MRRPRGFGGLWTTGLEKSDLRSSRKDRPSVLGDHWWKSERVFAASEAALRKAAPPSLALCLTCSMTSPIVVWSNCLISMSNFRRHFLMASASSKETYRW